MKKLLAPVLALTLLTAACSGDDGDDSADKPRLQVLAAASLTEVFDSLADQFEEQHDADLEFSFDSSTTLAEQAVDGAPGDVLATADQASMKIAEDGGVTGAVVPFAINELVLVTPPGNPGKVKSLKDLDGSTWVRCADDVPCGRVALDLLDEAKVDAEPASLEENVKDTLEKVTSGEADAGLVYASDATAAGDEVETIEIPGADAAPTTYYATTLTQSEAADLAGTWVEFVQSESGRRALSAAGFTLP